MVAATSSAKAIQMTARTQNVQMMPDAWDASGSLGSATAVDAAVWIPATPAPAKTLPSRMRP